MFEVLVFLLLTVIFGSILGCICLADFEGKGPTILILFLGTLLFILLTLAMVNQFGSGLARTEIEPGAYKVGFVYVAGDTVNLGIEKDEDTRAGRRGRGRENLYFYQLPKGVFDAPINEGAKKLFVFQKGSFKKLHLE